MGVCDLQQAAVKRCFTAALGFLQFRFYAAGSFNT